MNDYDGDDDFWKSYAECLRVIRERKASGGQGWGGTMTEFERIERTLKQIVAEQELMMSELSSCVKLADSIVGSLGSLRSEIQYMSQRLGELERARR
jgi:hypothetical protein